MTQVRHDRVTRATHLSRYVRVVDVSTRLERIRALTEERAHPKLIRAELDELLREQFSGELAPEHGSGGAESDTRFVERGLAGGDALQEQSGRQERARDPPARSLDREP